MKLVSVQDTKAQAFLNPAVARTTAEGLRLFESQCKNKESMFALHPADFILFEIGEWNELNGEITPYDKPRAIATASDFVQ
ncbi:MAG: nonstructural protein [Wigfec virus K19_137]|nr:MAG: nonstructural protein [Wigfec virus K19_137]